MADKPTQADKVVLADAVGTVVALSMAAEMGKYTSAENVTTACENTIKRVFELLGQTKKD